MPSFLLSAYSFLNGGSVPSSWVTLYCIGVSSFFNFSFDGFTYVLHGSFAASLAATAGVVSAVVTTVFSVFCEQAFTAMRDGSSITASMEMRWVFFMILSISRQHASRKETRNNYFFRSIHLSIASQTSSWVSPAPLIVMSAYSRY